MRRKKKSKITSRSGWESNPGTQEYQSNILTWKQIAGKNFVTSNFAAQISTLKFSVHNYFAQNLKLVFCFQVSTNVLAHIKVISSNLMIILMYSTPRNLRSVHTLFAQIYSNLASYICTLCSTYCISSHISVRSMLYAIRPTLWSPP
jgi:hypothetical protein